MNFQAIWDFLKELLAVAGGTATVLLLFGKWAVNKSADLLEKRYDEKLQEKLETHKAQLGKKEYISKTRFDTEFKIYQELSEKQMSAVYSIGDLVIIAHGMYGENDDKRLSEEERIDGLITDAEFSLKKFAPFISEKIYNKYRELDEQMRKTYVLAVNVSETQLLWIPDYKIHYKEEEYGIDEAYQEVFALCKDIPIESDAIIGIIRSYLSGLDVLD